MQKLIFDYAFLPSGWAENVGVDIERRLHSPRFGRTSRRRAASEFRELRCQVFPTCTAIPSSAAWPGSRRPAAPQATVSGHGGR